MNRCSTVNLGNGNVYDWIEKIQVRLLWPDFDHSLEQNDLNGHSVGVIFYPSHPVFQKDNTCYPDFSLRTPYSQRAYQQLCVKIFPEIFRFSKIGNNVFIKITTFVSPTIRQTY